VSYLQVILLNEMEELTNVQRSFLLKEESRFLAVNFLWFLLWLDMHMNGFWNLCF